MVRLVFCLVNDVFCLALAHLCIAAALDEGARKADRMLAGVTGTVTDSHAGRGWPGQDAGGMSGGGAGCALSPPPDGRRASLAGLVCSFAAVVPRLAPWATICRACRRLISGGCGGQEAEGEGSGHGGAVPLQSPSGGKPPGRGTPWRAQARASRKRFPPKALVGNRLRQKSAGIVADF